VAGAGWLDGPVQSGKLHTGSTAKVCPGQRCNSWRLVDCFLHKFNNAFSFRAGNEDSRANSQQEVTPVCCPY
jgi:hypothetical protein